MPSNCIFCTTYRQYHSFTNFVINYYRAPYKTYNSYKVNPFYSFFIYYLSNSIYTGEKKGIVLTTTFSGPFVAYNLNYSRYYFCYYFRYYFCYYFRRYFSSYTARVNLAATTSINLVAICYSPPYYRAARL